MEGTVLMPAEKIAITEACGRIISEDICSTIFHPPSDNSAMDGFAVRWDDVHSASKDNPVELKVLEDVHAGDITGVSLEKGEATSIMTGAPIPEGADTIIRIEDTNRSRGKTIVIYAAGKKGKDIRLKGENIKVGDKVYEAGQFIGPAEVGMLALMGKPFVSVYRKPTVAILVTGDEIRDLDEPFDENKITNSNGYALAAQVEEAGGVPVRLAIARDSKGDLRTKLSEALKSDIVVSSGGVSMGYHDYVKEVLQDLGVEIKFWRVDMRPGHPVAFGRKAEKPVFGLPGNPVSTMVSFEQFARPLIRAMAGHTSPYRPVVEAIVTEDVSSKPGRKHFLRGILSYEDGHYNVCSAGAQGSGILLSMSRSNCLIVIPDEGGQFKAGAKVKVQLLGPEKAGRKAHGY
ncbi:MAG: molybdopterin molybdotransferase MoeA [Proteobacteria bacterium]|nr:molybdopterin molybdotransferase MoeA [Pseudomonadota bacterium]